MRWFVGLPGPFGVSFGGDQKEAKIDGMEAVDYYELQQVESLRRFAVKLRAQGNEKRAARCEKKATRKEKQVQSNYIDFDGWERNYWS